MGRTGTPACLRAGRRGADLMAIAKGLGGGFQPIGAVLVGGRVIDAIGAGSGFFQHGHTYIGHAVAGAGCAGGATRAGARQDWLERCVHHGRRSRAELDVLVHHHPHVGDVRGRGLFQVSNWWQTEQRAPFDPAAQTACAHQGRGVDRGLMCYPMGGTIDGARGDHVLLAPPFIVTDDEIDLLVERLVEAVDTAIAGAR